MQLDGAAVGTAASAVRVGGRLLRSLAVLSALGPCAASRAARALQWTPPQPSLPGACPQGCSGHGSCREGTWCECDEHWAGDGCAYFIEASVAGQAAGDPTPSEAAGAGECEDWCSGHGHCEAGVCHCDQGWSGADCGVEERCEDECNSPSGVCVDGACVCEAGFSGPTCAERACPNGCWGHGACARGRCSCSPGWAGEECDLPDGGGAGAVAASWPVEPPPAALLSETPVEASPSQWPPRAAAPLASEAKVEAATTARPATEGLKVVDVEDEGSALVVPKLLETDVKASQQLRLAMGAAQRTLDAAKAISQKGSPLQKSDKPGAVYVSGAAAGGLDPAALAAAAAPAAAAPAAAGGHALAQVAAVQRHASAQQRLASARQQAGQQRQAAARQRAGSLPQAPTLAPGSCLEDCSGHGACNEGQCTCSDGWSGEACDLEPCPENCNGRGTCLGGTCACNSHYYGTACEHKRCPDDCSGHGLCDAGTCTCNVGFSGPACHAVAAAGARPSSAGVVKASPAHLRRALAGVDNYGAPASSCPEDCNGHGRCNTNGKCSCILGYTGESCSDYCPNDCSGRGTCTMGVCLCVGGFEGDDCSRQTCCSGHGDCDLPGTCVCEPGWMGEDCEVEMTCPDPTCSSHGECKLGHCECAPGWTGDTCGEPPKECGGPCPAEGSCDRESGLCMCGGTPCAGSSPAAPPASASLLGASAQPARKLLRQPSPGHRHPRHGASAGSATLGGTLRLLGGGSKVSYVPPAPDCNSPHGRWDDTLAACACESPYFGEECEQMHCPGFSEESGLGDCSGNGRCVAGQCICTAGWGKAAGKFGDNVCADRVCPVDCGEHGMCRDNQCICQEGWQGPSCRLPKCLNDCSGHGSCYFLTPNSLGECMCEYGYALPDCSTPALYARLPQCPNACSGHGLCFGGKCVCTSGFSGVDCSEVSCPEGRSGPRCELAACPRACDGKGLCLGGQCLCDPSRMGPDCSIPAKCFGACGKLCMANLEGQACEVCKGQCLTLTSGDSTLGQHDAMAEMMSTLQFQNRAAGSRSLLAQVNTSAEQEDLQRQMRMRTQRQHPQHVMASTNASRKAMHRHHREVMVKVLGNSSRIQQEHPQHAMASTNASQKAMHRHHREVMVKVLRHSTRIQQEHPQHAMASTNASRKAMHRHHREVTVKVLRNSSRRQPQHQRHREVMVQVLRNASRSGPRQRTHRRHREVMVQILQEAPTTALSARRAAAPRSEEAAEGPPAAPASPAAQRRLPARVRRRRRRHVELPAVTLRAPWGEPAQ